ncbi:MAG: thiamine-phosphate kinase [Myxococcota bacterium]
MARRSRRSGEAKTLADVGEGALIERIARRAGRTPGRDWALRIGDDAAILRPRAGDELVFSTDAFVEGSHFRFGRESSRTIGRRAMVANLSDLAAMGTEPVGALLSLAAPRKAALSDFDGIVAGVLDEAARFACPLVGGNLTHARSWSLDLTVIGRVPRARALRRRGARPGDALFVTGTLGGATLARLRADARGGALRRVARPRLNVGRALVRLPGVRACIDLSDGLATDLAHLLRPDALGAEIERDLLPRPRGFDRGCASLGLDADRVIAGGGEDYELLFAFRPGRSGSAGTRPIAALARRLGIPITRIGRITSEKGIRGLPRPERGHHFS